MILMRAGVRVTFILACTILEWFISGCVYLTPMFIVVIKTDFMCVDNDMEANSFGR